MIWLTFFKARVRMDVVPAPPKAPSPPARYAPVAIEITITVLFAYAIGTNIAQLNADHWQRGIDSFVLLCVVAIWSTHQTLAQWRDIFRSKPTATPLERELERLAKTETMLALSKTDSRYRAYRRRGKIQFGLLLGAIVLLVYIGNVFGANAALIGMFALAGFGRLLQRRFAF